jgi:uncharacterized membrane protein
MNALRAVSLLAATVSMGLVAGVFGLYAHTIMPGLGRTDDRTFVGAFQSIDRAIINPWFMGGGFFGALVSTVVAALAHIGQGGLPWIAAALALYLVAFVSTIVINVPLNDGIKRPGILTASPISPRSEGGSTRPGGGAGTLSAWSRPHRVRLARVGARPVRPVDVRLGTAG